MTTEAPKSRYTRQQFDQMIEDRKAEQVANLEAQRDVAEMDFDDEAPDQGNVIPDQEEPIEWFVDHYCPRTMFLLAGQEGIGKGLCAVWMATQFLSRRPKQGKVLILSTEDSGVEVRRRFTAAGLPKKEFDTRVFYGEQRLSEKYLGEFITQHDIQFIVLDALRDFTLRSTGVRGGANNDDATIRAALIRMRQFAQEHNIAIVGIHHTNKTSKDQGGKRVVVRERIGGAGAWQQVPRHVVFLDVRGSSDDDFAIGVTKSNLHPAGFTQTYTVDTVGGIGVKFQPRGDTEDELGMHQWKLDGDAQATVDPLTADEEYEIVLQALKQSRREDGTLLGAGPLWHEVLKDHGQIRKATIPAVLARIRADGIITGKTVKIEFTDEVIAREEAELEEKNRELRAKKGRK